MAWFFLSFETFRIFCRNIWHGSQNSIYVSRVKIAEKTVFYCFISRIFSNFEQNIFRILAKKLQKFVKTNFSVSTGTTCGFKLFLKVLKRFGFSAETFGMAHKILSTCPEKILRKKTVFLFSFQNFFGFWAKTFQSFGQKTSRICKNYLLRVQRNNLWLDFF